MDGFLIVGHVAADKLGQLSEGRYRYYCVSRADLGSREIGEERMNGS